MIPVLQAAYILDQKLHRASLHTTKVWLVFTAGQLALTGYKFSSHSVELQHETWREDSLYLSIYTDTNSVIQMNGVSVSNSPLTNLINLKNTIQEQNGGSRRN